MLDVRPIKSILKNNTNSSQNQMNNPQQPLSYKVSKKSPKTAKEYSQQKNNDELQDNQIKIKAAKIYKQFAQYLDPEILNKQATEAKTNKNFPDDSSQRLVAKNLEINQMWDSRLVQMFTDEIYYIKEMLDSAGDLPRDLKKKKKYGIYINAYLLYILKQNFGIKQFQITEGIYHNIALLMLIPIIRILKEKKVIEQNDKIDTQGLMEVQHQAYSQGQKNAYKINHIFKINMDEKNPILVILNITKMEAKDFEDE